MTIRPRLNVICGRCGKRREGLRHVCRSNSTRRATPRLKPVLGGCARCGKPYGGRNGNPLTHVCRPRDGDFRSRRTAYQNRARRRARAAQRQAERDKQRDRLNDVRQRERERSRHQLERLKNRYQQRLDAERDKARSRHRDAKPKPRPRRPPHEYQSCTDQDCQRPVCLAFREGYLTGRRDGLKEGFEQGYDKGFPDGVAACPRPHK